MQWCVVKSGEQSYGIPVEHVLEVIKDASVERVPGAPDGVVGLINLRGQLVVALDVRGLVEGVGSGRREKVTAVVANHAGESVALCVDAVLDVKDVNDDMLVPPPVGSGGLGKVSDHVVLDSESIVAGVDLSKLIKRVGRAS